MEMDPQNNKDGDGSILKLKLAESELAMLVVSQEVDKYKRECMFLNETVSRLEEDRNTLRKREQRDAQTIRNLLEKIARNEREFSDKLAELTMRNWDLECALRAKGVQILELVKEEKCHVVEKEKGFQNGNVNELHPSDEMPKRTSAQKRDFVVVDRDSDDDEDEDWIPLSQKLSKKRALDVANRESGSSLNHSFEATSIGAKETSAAAAETQTPNDSKELSAKEVQAYPKRNVKNQDSQRVYTGRIASIEQKTCAVNEAKLVQRNLMSRNPSWLRQMTLSNVSGCFWLHLPRKFCKEYLPDHEHRMILEDEKGMECEVNYIGNRTALSGGWRGFAIAHNLELDDVLIFELCDPTRFKVLANTETKISGYFKTGKGKTSYNIMQVYIVKAIMESTEDINDKIAGESPDGTSKMANLTTGYGNEDVDLSDFNKTYWTSKSI